MTIMAEDTTHFGTHFLDHWVVARKNLSSRVYCCTVVDTSRMNFQLYCAHSCKPSVRSEGCKTLRVGCNRICKKLNRFRGYKKMKLMTQID